MTRLLSLIPLALATLVTGCAYPNQFRNVHTESSHAILVGDGVTLMHINDLPTSFWRCRERFRVSPGPTTLRAIAGHWDVHEYAVLQFAAEAGHIYSLRRERADGSDHVVLRDSGERIIAQAERQPTK